MLFSGPEKLRLFNADLDAERFLALAIVSSAGGSSLGTFPPLDVMISPLVCKVATWVPLPLEGLDLLCFKAEDNCFNGVDIGDNAVGLLWKDGRRSSASECGDIATDLCMTDSNNGRF